jgi:hypothetical protein
MPLVIGYGSCPHFFLEYCYQAIERCVKFCYALIFQLLRDGVQADPNGGKGI